MRVWKSSANLLGQFECSIPFQPVVIWTILFKWFGFDHAIKRSSV